MSVAQNMENFFEQIFPHINKFCLLCILLGQIPYTAVCVQKVLRKKNDYKNK